MKHSVCVFFAWHGLESCWCFGLFDSDADETLSSHRSESTAFGCSGTGPKFFLFSFFFIFLADYFFLFSFFYYLVFFIFLADYRFQR